MRNLYPIYLDMNDKLGVVIGGGIVAQRKVEGLREAGARVRVVSPEWTPGLQALVDAGQIEALCARYDSSHLAGAALVFAATNDRSVNAQVCHDAAERGLFVCVADAPEEGDFILPGVVRRGELCISFSSGGNSPMFTANLRREMEARFGPEYAELIELLGRQRQYIQEREPQSQRRRAALDALLQHEEELRALLRDGQATAAETRAHALVVSALESGDQPTPNPLPKREGATHPDPPGTGGGQCASPPRSGEGFWEG